MPRTDAHKLALTVATSFDADEEVSPDRWFATVYEDDREINTLAWFATEAKAREAGEEWAEEYRRENELVPLLGGGYRDPRDGAPVDITRRLL